MRESTVIRLGAWVLILSGPIAKALGHEVPGASRETIILAAVVLFCTGWALRAFDK